MLVLNMQYVRHFRGFFENNALYNIISIMSVSSTETHCCFFKSKSVNYIIKCAFLICSI